MARARFFEVAVDPRGRPIGSVIVNVYQPGTTTPITETIYAAVTGPATLPNPLTANVQGEIEFFLELPKRVDLKWSQAGFLAESHAADVIWAEETSTSVAAEMAARIAADALLIPLAQKGAPGGVATLDGATTVPDAQIPAAIARDVEVTAAVSTHAASPTAHSGTYVALLAASNGSNDTIALNTALASGGRLRGKAGENYLISAPLVLVANTELDMTGCTVTLLASSNCNMVNNTARTAARTVIDGVMMAASTTLTSATAAFVAGDVGKAVTVVGADSTGTRRLITTIASVTNGTTVVLAASAVTAVTNAWVTVGTRDQNITIIGGTWDRGANGAGAVAGYNGSSIRLRRVDNVHVRDVQMTGTNGKYAVSFGDCWQFYATRVTNSGASDTVHVNGPARHGVIRDTYGRGSGDDVVSLTCADFTIFPNAQSSMMDVYGDINNVLIDGAQAEYGNQRGAIVLAGTVSARAMNISDITVRNVKGHFRAGAVLIGGDTQDANTQGGTYTGIYVDGVQNFGALANVALGTVILLDGTQDDITIRNVTADPLDTAPVTVGPGTLTCTVGRLVVDGISWLGGFSPNAAVLVGRASVDDLIVENARVKTTSTGACLVRLAASFTPASSVNRVVVSNSYLENASGGSTSGIVIATDVNSTLPVVSLSNVRTKNVTYPLGRYATITRVKAANLRLESASAQIRAEVTAVVTLETIDIDSNTYIMSFVAGGTVRPILSGFQTDLSTVGLAPQAGDVVWNTNSAIYGGVGPKVYDGTTWRDLVVQTPPPMALSFGEETVSREIAAGGTFTIVSGTLSLSYFTARKSEVVTQIRTITRGTAAAGLTLCRIGIYSVDSSGNITLVGSTPSDTTLFTATFTNWAKSFSANFTKVQNQLYAFGLLVVGTTMPAFYASNIFIQGAGEDTRYPRLVATVASQADLPSSVAVGSLAAGVSTGRFYAVVSP